MLLPFISPVIMSAAVLSIALLSPFVDDSEGFVASKFPPDLANAVRDDASSWDAFNAVTVGLAVPALAAAKPESVKYFLEGNIDLEELGVSYGVSESQRLDIYYHSASSISLPVVVFVHGGAWSHGYRGMYSLLARRLRDSGYVVIVAGYRRYPEGSVGEQVQDVGGVIGWVEENIVEYGGDGRDMTIVGHSSGAHISALHLLTTRGDCRLGAFVGMCGVYDIVEHYKWEERRGVHEISALKVRNQRLCKEVKHHFNSESSLRTGI